MLVTLEGLDGSGKTTVWEELKDQYPAAQLTREPTESWYGDTVRRSVTDQTADPLAELFLYMADHAAHLATTIRPALAEERLVISDRYLDSRYAYQAATLADHFDDPLGYIRSIHEPFTRYPDLTLYLDIDPETAVARSSRANKFEQLDHLRNVRANYERLIDAAPERFVRIDATQSSDAVVSAAIDAIDSHRE